MTTGSPTSATVAPGRVTILNGTSSAGKTSIARAMQALSPSPLMHWSIDTLFACVPPRWGGGLDLPESREGLWYDRERAGQEPPRVVIRYGPIGLRMLLGGQRAAAALARAGNDVVVDEVLLSPDLLAGWREATAGLDVAWVRVDCAIEELERRERNRRNPRGLARGHLDTVHPPGLEYGARVATDDVSPEDAAATLLRWRG